jgi:predicted ABC-type ATPase
MIYFGIEDLESSLSRVKVRVSLGGHDVQLKDIAFNLTEGIVRVKKDIRLFDNVLFVDTSTVGKASVIASYRKDTGDHLILQEDVHCLTSISRNRY